jgi:hypothetical protein
MDTTVVTKGLKMDTYNGREFVFNQAAHDEGFEGKKSNPYDAVANWDNFASFQAGEEAYLEFLEN